MKKGMFKQVCMGLLMAAALAVAIAGPVEPEPVALVHVERVHIMEPGETIFSVARQYFKEQRQYDEVNRFIYAVRLANGLDKSFQPGDRIIIPLAVSAK
jgi:hypothetical protein